MSNLKKGFLHHHEEAFLLLKIVVLIMRFFKNSHRPCRGIYFIVSNT